MFKFLKAKEDSFFREVYRCKECGYIYDVEPVDPALLKRIPLPNVCQKCGNRLVFSMCGGHILTDGVEIIIARRVKGKWEVKHNGKKSNA